MTRKVFSLLLGVVALGAVVTQAQEPTKYVDGWGIKPVSTHAGDSPSPVDELPVVGLAVALARPFGAASENDEDDKAVIAKASKTLVNSEKLFLVTRFLGRCEQETGANIFRNLAQEISRARVYASLRRLEGLGVVEVRAQEALDGTRGRPGRLYGLTAHGRAALERAEEAQRLLG